MTGEEALLEIETNLRAARVESVGVAWRLIQAEAALSNMRLALAGSVIPKTEEDHEQRASETDSGVPEGR